jgi:hypothetical protein
LHIEYGGAHGPIVNNGTAAHEIQESAHEVVFPNNYQVPYRSIVEL